VDRDTVVRVAAGSECRGIAKRFFAGAGGMRFGDSDLCDNNNDRGRVDAACASLTGDGVPA